MNRKNELTSKVLQILHPNHTEKDFKKAKFDWWENPRTKDTGGFQLTKAGFNALVNADIKSYKVKIEKKFKAKSVKNILWLDQHLNSPYYFHSEGGHYYIFVFDERTAVQLMLFSGNIEKMLRAAQKYKEKQT